MSTTTPYFAVVAVLFIVLALGIVGQCEYKDRQSVPELTREQRAEVMSRQTAFDRAQHIDMADRVLAARVEREWRELQSWR